MTKIANPVKPLALVNVYESKKDGSREIEIGFLPDPDLIGGEEDVTAFLALDASASIKKMYGTQGPFVSEPKYVEAVGQKIGSLLCSLSKSGKVTGIYWAITPPGDQIQVFGEMDDAGWQKADISGPGQKNWGKGTKLLPVIRYGYEMIFQKTKSKMTMGVVLTDGIIEDEKDCLAYCLQIGKEQAGKNPTPFKLVLIGVGEEIDEGQLERFDDMFEGSGIDYDLWSHGMVSSIRDEGDILSVLYGELADENTIVAPSATILDEKGIVVSTFADGLPGKFRFVLPSGKKFTIHTPNGDITQDISEIA